MPPFQNADEGAHLRRADQISHGGWVGQRLADGEIGGMVDAGLTHAPDASEVLHGNQAQKIRPGMFVARPWGEQVAAGFPNTAIYGPVLYVPAAAALGIGRALGADVMASVLAARLAMGVCALVLAGLALALAEGAGLWLFSLLVLPMSAALMAGAVPDGPMLGATALAAVLCARLRGAGEVWMLPVACGLLAVIGMSRPPYLAFAACLLANGLPWRVRLAAVAAVVLPGLAWAWANAGFVQPPDSSVDAAAQLRFLLAAPWHVPGIAWRTMRFYGGDVLVGFIGQLGWLDVALPRWLHWLARGLVVLAAGLSLRWARRDAGWALGLAGIAAACVGIAALEYLSWTPVGAPAVLGLQGRYFLPPALMLAALCRPHKGGLGVAMPVLAAPLVYLPVVLSAMHQRYGF